MRHQDVLAAPRGGYAAAFGARPAGAGVPHRRARESAMPIRRLSCSHSEKAARAGVCRGRSNFLEFRSMVGEVI
jgi:hypothetical protein